MEPNKKISLDRDRCRIAAREAGFDFIGCEIDKEYFAKQEERWAAHTAQVSMFHDF